MAREKYIGSPYIDSPKPSPIREIQTVEQQRQLRSPQPPRSTRSEHSRQETGGREGNDWRLVQNNDRHQSIALYLNPVSVEASQLSTHLSTCKVKLLRRAPHLRT